MFRDWDTPGAFLPLVEYVRAMRATVEQLKESTKDQKHCGAGRIRVSLVH